MTVDRLLSLSSITASAAYDSNILWAYPVHWAQWMVGPAPAGYVLSFKNSDGPC